MDDDQLERTANAMIAVVRQAQHDNLHHAWEMGRLLEEALAEADESGAKGIARDLLQRLNRAGCELGLSTLYGYRTIYQGYERDDLAGLIERGITQTHAILLQGLGSEARAQIEHDMAGPDGRAVSSRELKKMVEQARKQAARAEAEAAVADSETSRASGVAMSARSADADAEVIASTDPEAGGVARVDLLQQATPAQPATGESVIAGPVGSPVEPDVAPGGVAARRGDVDRTKAMARGPKEFSVSPIKVLKQADTTAINMLGQAKDLLIALDEVERVGYDSERSLKNFLDAATSLRTSLSSYAKLLPELEQRIGSAVRSNTIAD